MYRVTVHGYLPHQAYRTDIARATAGLEATKARLNEHNAMLDKTLKNLGIQPSVPQNPKMTV